MFRTADTPELRDHFGSGNTRSDRQTPYPLCRVVTVMNVHSHALLDAQINSYRTNEMKLASDMLDKLPDKVQARAVTYQLGHDSKTVLTALPAEHFEVMAVAALYHQRWQIEPGFRDIKSSMQHNALTLRSKTVALVYQALWGWLLAYNLIRHEASLAALSQGYSSDDVSFKFACQFIAAALINMAVAVSPANTPKRLKNLRGNIAILF